MGGYSEDVRTAIKEGERNLKLINYLLLSTCAFASTIIAAEKNDLKERLAQIQAELQQGANLKLDFQQTIYTSLRRKKRNSTGQAYFQKPARFRWAIDKPIAKHLIYDGKTFAEINPKAKTGTIYPDSSGKLKQYVELVSIVMDIEKLTSRFDIKEIVQSAQATTIKLAPKSNDGIATVELKVAKEEKYISEIKISYQGGNYWQVDFSTPQRTSLPSETFTLPSDKTYNLRTLVY